MKKTILLPVLALLASWSFAQPVLDQTAVGQIGDIFYLGIQDTFSPGFTLGSPGANQTWSFDTLLINNRDTVWFLDPNDSPFGVDFPNANLSIQQASLDGIAFLELSAGHLDIVGLASDVLQTGTPIVVHQNPPSRLAAFPFTYLNTYNNVTQIDVTIDATSFGIPFVDSARYKNIQDRDVIADGYGTLNLPIGPFSNVLRVKDIVNQKDSIWVHTVFTGWYLYQDSVYTDSTFTWWNSSKGYYLAQASYSGPELSSLRYQDPVVVGRPEPTANLYAIYPNPAHDRLFIDTDGKVQSIQITDLQGRIVANQALLGARATVETGQIPAGYYLYSLLDKNGVARQTGKLILNH